MNEISRSKNRKPQNPFKAYFSNFGLSQISDLTVLAAVITTVFGLIFDTKFQGVNVITLIGGILYLAGFSIRLYVTINKFKTIKNKRSPLFRQAIINFVIIGLLMVLAILLIIYSIR